MSYIHISQSTKLVADPDIHHIILFQGFKEHFAFEIIAWGFVDDESFFKHSEVVVDGVGGGFSSVADQVVADFFGGNDTANVRGDEFYQVFEKGWISDFIAIYDIFDEYGVKDTIQKGADGFGML